MASWQQVPAELSGITEADVDMDMEIETHTGTDVDIDTVVGDTHTSYVHNLHVYENICVYICNRYVYMRVYIYMYIYTCMHMRVDGM